MGNLLGDTSGFIDPLLGPLAYNGGPLKTMALLCGSPAIDAADSLFSFNDQRDSAVFNGRRDIGAFELTKEIATQDIPIDLGWGMISSYIIPDEPDMDSIIKGSSFASHIN